MVIKYLTLNILHGGKFLKNIIDFVKKEDPDITAFQEVYDTESETNKKYLKSRELLKEKLGYSYSNYAPNFIHLTSGLEAGFGNMVLSKFEIIDSEVNFYMGSEQLKYKGSLKSSTVPKNLQHVTLSANGKILNVFNTHGVWGKDGKDNKARLNMAKAIVSKVKGAKLVILSGDFNVNEGTHSIEMIEKHLINIFRGERVTSFNMLRKPKNSGYGTAVVDFIFVSPDIKVLNHYQPDVDISDHFPLVAVLDLN